MEPYTPSEEGAGSVWRNSYCVIDVFARRKPAAVCGEPITAAGENEQPIAAISKSIFNMSAKAIRFGTR